MITVTTNHHERPVIDAWELSPAERAEFDYLDWPAIEAGTDSRSFFRYRGELYDLGDFIERAPRDTPGRWDAYASDSFFSGIVVRLSEDGDGIVVGTLIAS